MITFGIPCKWESNSLVEQCVANIFELHDPKDIRVVVVDSASDNKAYMPTVRAMGAIVEDIGNRNYETGAWWHVYENFESDHYFFLHDSLMLKKPIYDCLDNDFTTIAYSDAWHWIEEPELLWAISVIEKSGVKFKTSGFTSIFGSMFMCTREQMDALKDLNFDAILPTDKGGSRAMERLWGLAFCQLGLENSIRENALYGPIYDILQVRNDRLDKTIVRRD